MESINSPPEKSKPSNDATCETLLAEIRCARIRAELTRVNLDFVGIALKHRLVSVEQAMAALHERGALPYLFLEKEDAT